MGRGVMERQYIPSGCEEVREERLWSRKPFYGGIFLNQGTLTEIMEDLQKFRTINRLKRTYRLNSVGDRKESSAEHSWSCLILADFFLPRIKVKLDRLRVYELLMYHDMVEIEAGDTPLHPHLKMIVKSEREKIAVKELKKQLPKDIGSRFEALFEEFENGKTMEAKFARAIDSLDAVINQLDHKQEWEGWTKEFLIEKKSKHFEVFPDIKLAFHSLLSYAEENGYFAVE